MKKPGDWYSAVVLALCAYFGVALVGGGSLVGCVGGGLACCLLLWIHGLPDKPKGTSRRFFLRSALRNAELERLILAKGLAAVLESLHRRGDGISHLAIEDDEGNGVDVLALTKRVMGDAGVQIRIRVNDERNANDKESKP